MAIGYLEQEGMMEDIPYAIVDSGWIGTIQQSLQRLVQTKQIEKRLMGYYFGLYEIPKAAEQEKYRAYYFMTKRQIRRKVKFSNCLFETICSSENGMTLGYVEQEEMYQALESTKKNPNKVLLKKNEKILLDYLNYYLVERKEDSVNISEAILSKLMGNPKWFEVELFGNWLFCDDVLELQMQTVAANLSDEEIKNQRFLNKWLILCGIKKGKIRESAWIEGSIVKNKKNIKKNLFHAKIYKYFVYMRKAIKR